MDAQTIAVLDDALFRFRVSFYGRHTMEPFYQAFGGRLPPRCYRLLRLVEIMAPERPAVGQVADGLNLDRPTASRLVARAAQDGLLRLVAAAHDRRRRELVLTDPGRELLHRAGEVRRARLADLLATWDDEAAVALAGYLDDITAGCPEPDQANG